MLRYFKGIYAAAYPLHSGECDLLAEGKDPQTLSPRAWLYNTWGSWKAWKKYQPLDEIKVKKEPKLSVS